MTVGPSELFTPFLPSTYTVPEEEDRLRAFLVDNLSDMSDVINDKKIGCYTQEACSQDGEKWIYKTTSKIRTGYQTIAFIPTLPNNTTLTLTLTSTPKFPIPNVGPQFVITKVFGSASKPCSANGAGDGSYFTFNNQGDSRISFTMSDIQIVITTTTDLRAYQAFIVIEFLYDGI